MVVLRYGACLFHRMVNQFLLNWVYVLLVDQRYPTASVQVVSQLPEKVGRKSKET